VESLRGQLLIAGGGLFDPNFRHAVVLVAERGEEGALGIILNRPAELRAAEAAPALASYLGAGDHLFLGGPVQTEAAILLAELQHPDLFRGTLVVNGIGLVGGEDELGALEDVRRARLFAGHAGWGPGQLEGELEQSSWIVEPARPDDVFATNARALWPELLRRKGGKHAVLALMPFDPSTN
jgi:putative transcriptional regulator